MHLYGKHAHEIDDPCDMGKYQPRNLEQRKGNFMKVT